MLLLLKVAKFQKLFSFWIKRKHKINFKKLFPRLMDKDFIYFLRDGTKMKIPSEIQPPFMNFLMRKFLQFLSVRKTTGCLEKHQTFNFHNGSYATFFENFNLTKKNLELFAIFFAKLLTSARSSFTQKKNFFTTHILSQNLLFTFVKKPVVSCIQFRFWVCP